MDVIYWLIPSMIVIGIVLVALLFWSARSGQYDDMDGEAYRILMDEDLIQNKDEEESETDKNKK